MSSECDALRNEIQRLRQEIAGLNNRFIPIAEKPRIYSAIAAADRKADDAIGIANKAIRDVVIVSAIATAAQAAAAAAAALAATAATAAASALAVANAVLVGLTFVLNQLRAYVIRERFSALEARVNAVEGGLDVLTRLAQFLKRKIDENSAAIANLLYRVNALASLVAALQSAIDRIGARLGNLELRVDALEAWMAQAVIQIRSLFVRVNTLEDLLKALDRKVDNLGRRVTALVVTVTALGATVAALGAAVAALALAVKGLIAAVARLTALVAAMRALIAGLSRQVVNLTARVRVVETLVQLANRTAAYARDRAIEAISLARAAVAKAQVAFTKASQALAIGRLALSKANQALSLAQRALAKIQDLTRLVLRIDFRVQILERLMQLIQQRLTEIKELLLGSANGKIDLTPCNPEEEETRMIGFSGTGLTGLYSTTKALAEVVETLHDNTKCNSEILKRLEGSGRGRFDLSLCEPPEDPDAEPLETLYEGDGLKGIYLAIAGITDSLNLIHEDTKCPPEGNGNAALPMYFETRSGEIPQLVVQWGPVEGGSSRWSMSIPHPKAGLKNEQLSFPPYVKGNIQLTYVLTDNSKVILNAATKQDALSVFEYVKTLINPAFLNPLAEPKIIEGAGQGLLKVLEVKATYAQYFLGHRNQMPIWVRNLARQ